MQDVHSLDMLQYNVYLLSIEPMIGVVVEDNCTFAFTLTRAFQLPHLLQEDLQHERSDQVYRIQSNSKVSISGWNNAFVDSKTCRQHKSTVYEAEDESSGNGRSQVYIVVFSTRNTSKNAKPSTQSNKDIEDGTSEAS
jgi:hypothetical protein